MENKYQEGKIYKIVCNITSEIYIGSTIETLKERVRKHNVNKNCVSRNIIERGDYKIELIKDYPCNSKYELEEEETKYIKNNKCINKNLPHRTQQQYLIDNREIHNNKQKKFYQDNKEQIKIQKKEKVLCECGVLIRKSNILVHRKSLKHIKLLEEKSI